MSDLWRVDADDSSGAVWRQKEAVLPRCRDREGARPQRRAIWKSWGTTIPPTNPAQVLLKHERIEHWTKNGAQMSDTVKRLVEKNPAPVAATGRIVTESAPNCKENNGNA